VRRDSDILSWDGALFKASLAMPNRQRLRNVLQIRNHGAAVEIVPRARREIQTVEFSDWADRGFEGRRLFEARSNCSRFALRKVYCLGQETNRVVAATPDECRMRIDSSRLIAMLSFKQAALHKSCLGHILNRNIEQNPEADHNNKRRSEVDPNSKGSASRSGTTSECQSPLPSSSSPAATTISVTEPRLSALSLPGSPDWAVIARHSSDVGFVFSSSPTTALAAMGCGIVFTETANVIIAMLKPRDWEFARHPPFISLGRHHYNCPRLRRGDRHRLCGLWQIHPTARHNLHLELEFRDSSRPNRRCAVRGT
jgi:hypothetical protein